MEASWKKRRRKEGKGKGKGKEGRAFVYLVALRLQYPYVPSPALVCSFALSTTFAQLGVFNLALQPQRSGYPFPCPLPGPQGTEEEKKGKQSEATDKQGQQTRCSRCQIIRENEKSVLRLVNMLGMTNRSWQEEIC